MSNFILLPVVKNPNQGADTKDVLFNTKFITYCEPTPKFDNRCILGVLTAANPYIVAVSVEKVLKLIEESQFLTSKD